VKNQTNFILLSLFATLSLATIPLSSAAEAQFRINVTDKYQYQQGGGCRGNRCSSFVQWYGFSCGEFSPDGYLIRGLESQYCRYEVGTYYQWVAGTCQEFTPDGATVRTSVDKDKCQRECGVVRSRGSNPRDPFAYLHNR
jgi:hypothetical protein